MGVWNNLSPGASVAMGIIVGLMSTCVQSVGLTLQRKSHMMEDEKADCEARRPAYRRRRWQVGMLLFLIANIVGSTIQITTLPLPLLSTLQASGLVFNSLMASLLLKEPWTWRTGYGTLLVAAGAVLISLFSALPEPSHSLEQLVRLLGYRSFLVWFILSLVFVGGMLAMDFAMRRFLSGHRRDSPRLHLVRGMSYGAISGILSAHSLLLAKSAVELIVRSVADHTNQFSNYRSWLLILAFLVLALSQLYYLHLGLRLISTSILYPFVFCIYNIVAILDGLIYFRQMDRLPPLHAGLIALGTVILLAGVLALSWRLQGEEEQDPDHHQHAAMGKHEIPQTVLTPGLGFVGDPDSDENSASAVADDDDAEMAENRERAALLGGGTKRKSTSRSSNTAAPYSGRKRKRAATLREVIHIWEELEDGDEERYGTFETDPAPGHIKRPASAGQPTSRRGRESDLEVGREQNDGSAEVDPLLECARTMPSERRSRSERRRRSTHEGGALFSDLLKVEWWRTKRKDRESDEAENRERGSGEGHGPHGLGEEG